VMMRMNEPLTETQSHALPSGIRSWRVGSLSMGVTLVMIGTALAVSLWQDLEAYQVLLWVAPIVFILLGAELLLYLKFSGSARVVVRYDWMSVFFVGAVGTASLALALLMSTGLFDELQRQLHMTERSLFVASKTVKVPADVEKIVVQSLTNVQISETEKREVHLFGQVTYWSAEEMKRLDNKLLETKTVGSTMYVMIGTIERRDGGLIADTISPNFTLLVPENVVIERQP
jgi:hypothetical protein